MSQIKTKFITDNAVTNSKLSQMPTATLKGNSLGITGAAADLTVSAVQTLLSIPTTASPLPLLSGGTGVSAASENVAFNTLSPLSAKGDLVGFSTVNARIPVGSNTQVLTADSTQTLGVKWATPTTGTVTTVSVVTANGVSGSVATATTTPAITLTLGAITPTSVAASGTVTGSNLSGTNTGNVTLAAVGASPNANGATLSGQALNLEKFSSAQPGVVAASGGGTTNFLRADGTWAAPATGSSPVVLIVSNPSSTSAPNAIIYATVEVDTGSNYNNSTGVFTAPTTGYYQMSAWSDQGASNTSNFTAYVNGSAGKTFGTSQATGRLDGTVVVSLTAGDALTNRATNSNIGGGATGWMTITQIH